jgi:IgGFc binding protein
MKRFVLTIGKWTLAALGAFGCAQADDGTHGGGNGSGAGGGAGGLGGGIIGTGGNIINPGTGGGAGDNGVSGDDPQTCADAEAAKSYVGCEFWPTVSFSPVWSLFDFAAVVANASQAEADVTVERGGTMVASVKVAPGSLEKIYLPWVKELKGADFDKDTRGGRPLGSVRVDKGAYHLTSSVPVTVWQFSPLEYKAGSGGPPGKDWTCPYPPTLANGNGIDCLSVDNDASLLIPTASLTGTYRLFGKSGTRGAATPDADDDAPGAYAITATKDGTNVTVSLLPNPAAGALPPMPNHDVEGGNGVAATAGGNKLTFAMNAGDVVELLAARGARWLAPDSDLSGSLVNADKPIQIIAVVPITNIPTPAVPGNGYADHLEETVLPAEVLGDHYLVAPPTAPKGNTVGHFVRFYGNRDGTTLTYPSGNAPPNAPTMLNAGQVVDLRAPASTDETRVTEAFEVQGDHEFAVASIMLGGQLQNPTTDPVGSDGDPSMSFEVAIKQFRKSYIFLAPTDYATSFADVLLPAGAQVSIDGAALNGPSNPVGTSGWTVVRQPLGPGMNGAHVLRSDQPVGLQFMGFGHATSYYTPGGLNLNLISPPPVIN